MAVTPRVSESADGLVVIRRGRLGDLKAILSIERAAFGRHALEPSTLFWLLLRRWPGFLIAEVSHHLAGYVITRLSPWRWGRRRGGITSLAVHPFHLRQGIGRSLMQTALEFLREARVKVVELEVSVENAPALALYRSLGFVSRETLPNYYGRGKDGVRMCLKML